MADPGKLFGELQGKLGLEASENSIFEKLTSKIGPNSNFCNFYEKVKNLKLPQKLIGNRYEAENFKEIEEPSLTAFGNLDWNDPLIFLNYHTNLL